MDEVIRGIERADAQDIQDIMHAAMERYRELYPKWRMMFLSVDPDATDERSCELRILLQKAEEILLEKEHGNINEK